VFGSEDVCFGKNLLSGMSLLIGMPEAVVTTWALVTLTGDGWKEIAVGAKGKTIEDG